MQNKKRFSEKREMILSLFKNGDLLTAADVCERLPEIDRATIYRNITKFVEEKILREVHVKKGISSYELFDEKDMHQHFLCEGCEKVLPIDIDPKIINKLIPKDLKVQNVELNLTGKCSNCK